MNPPPPSQRIALILAGSTDTAALADALVETVWAIGKRPADCVVSVFATETLETLESHLSGHDNLMSAIADEVRQFRACTSWHVRAVENDLELPLRRFKPTVRILLSAATANPASCFRPIKGCRDIHLRAQTSRTSATTTAELAHLAVSMLGNSDRWLRQTNQHIADLQRATKDEPVTLYGAGASLSSVAPTQLDDRNTIICNEMVKQNDLTAQISPIAICASGRGSGASHSADAEEFRQSLVIALRTHPVPFFFPLRDLATYLHHLPADVHRNLAPLPSAIRDDFTIDLASRLEVKSTAHVLTLLMLPLAFTLTERVSVMGFDGEDDNSDGTSPHAETQFNEASLCTGHAFTIHDSIILTALLKQAELNGKYVRSQTRSYIPALRSRELAQTLGDRGPDVRSKRVHEFGPLSDSLAILHPLGISVHEQGNQTTGLREYLEIELRLGYTTDWASELPSVAAFTSPGDALAFLEHHSPDLVLVSSDDDSFERLRTSATWPSRWYALTWKSASEPGERREFYRYRSHDAGATEHVGGHGLHWTALGFESEVHSDLFGRILEGVIRS